MMDDLIINKDKCVLSKVNPFDDLFYKNCFYNCQITLCSQKGISKEDFLINDLYRDSIFKNKYEYCSADAERLKDLGVVYYGTSENVLDYIINKINKGSLVLSFIDLFYVPYRKDTYLKKRALHAVVIYGYDMERDSLYLYDQKNFFSLEYISFEIKIKDFLMSTENIKSMSSRYDSDDLYEGFGICGIIDKLSDITIVQPNLCHKIRTHYMNIISDHNVLKEKFEQIDKDEMQKFTFVFNNMLIRKQAEEVILSRSYMDGTYLLEEVRNIIKEVHMLKNMVIKKNCDGDKVRIQLEQIVNKEQVWYAAMKNETVEGGKNEE